MRVRDTALPNHYRLRSISPYLASGQDQANLPQHTAWPTSASSR